MTLVEVMVAAGLASIVSMAIIQSITYMNKATNAIQVKQDILDKMNQLQGYLSGSACVDVFAANGNLAPLATRGNQAYTMKFNVPKYPGQIFLQATTKIGNNWITQSVEFLPTSISSAMVNPRATDAWGVFYSIDGNLNIKFTNLAVTKKTVLGATDTYLRTIPFTFTMGRDNGGQPMKITSCTSYSVGRTDQGWNNSQLTDVNYCRAVPSTSRCPFGFYVVGFSGGNMTCCKLVR